MDLRDNRGGLVQEGIEIAKLFLPGPCPRSLLLVVASSWKFASCMKDFLCCRAPFCWATAQRAW